MRRNKRVRLMIFCLIFIIALSQNCFYGNIAKAAEFKSADLNGDRAINMADVILLASIFGSTLGDGKYIDKYDLNSDGVINMADVIAIANDFNKTITSTPTNSPTQTPTNTSTPTATKAPTPTSTPTTKPSSTPVPIKVPIVGGNLDASSIKTKYINIAYASVSKTQALDIYIPNEGSGPFPVIIAIHGGAFLGGSSKGSDIAPMVENGINHGYAVVSLNYRLSAEAKFPAPVGDVKAAVRYVRANAAKYNFDTTRIAAWGDSSGGFLVSMLGTSANVSELNSDTKENLNYSSAVNAVVDWFGHIDFLTMDDQFKASGLTSAFGSTNSASSPASQLIGKQITLDPVLTEKANPETYISTMTATTTPSFFIQHGSSDNVVPYQQSTNFAAKLKQAIGDSKVKLEIINGASHGTSEFTTTANLNKVMAFLDGIFK
ncbi:MAG: alpha/beta hydrolase fold domain-containing protein [Bacillota bacterium]|nr:alpha/beta hydrolase fold domain-containing protein [Bacillota bacterium]